MFSKFDDGPAYGENESMRSSDRGKIELVTDITPTDKAKNPLIDEIDTSKIELVGIPGERQEDGQFIVNQKVTQFFKELISKEVFSEDYQTCGCQFESLKIWLYDTSYSAELRGDQFPKMTNTAIHITSPEEKSALASICVLDSGFEDREYDAWTSACQKLYTPLFKRFVPPPDPPDVLKDFLEIRFGSELSSKLNLYLDMRNNLFFDALIIQMNQVSLGFKEGENSGQE